MFFDLAFWPSVIIALITGVVALIRTKYDGQAIAFIVVEFLLSAIVSTLIIWAILWQQQPEHTGTLGGYSYLLFALLITGLIFLIGDIISSAVRGDDKDVDFGLGGILAVILVCCLAGFYGFNGWTVRGQEEADKVASLVHVERQDANAYPDSDANQMVQVSEPNARYKASQVVAKQTTGENGQGVNLGTAFQPGDPQIQSVQNHLYWIFSLNFASRRTWDQVGQVSPGYIVVDAEDPNAEPQLKLGFKMRYTPDAWYGSKLQRRIYNSGYSDYVVDDITLEVDDQWNPFYTAALEKKLLYNSGAAPVAMIVVDPQSGKITKYDLDSVPVWVDRIYSQETVKRLVGWWGEWGDKVTAPYRCATCSRTNSGRLQISSDPVVVYTKEGPAWQMTLTSRNSDNGVAGVLLFDTRDNKVRLYSVIDGTPVEGAVLKAFQSIPENAAGNGRYQATHLSLHKIYGQPTWVANYVLKSDNPSQGEPYVGIGFVDAKRVQGATVAFAQTKEQALTKYRQLLARNADNSAPGENSVKSLTAQGAVKYIASQIQDGNTVYFLVLFDTPEAPKQSAKVFKAGRDVGVELPFIQVGDQVVIIYVDVGQNPVDVSQIDDTNLSIGK